MVEICFVSNPADPGEWEIIDAPGLIEEIARRYPVKPKGLKIYCGGEITSLNDVTPYDKASVDKLRALPGPFTVLVGPELTPFEWFMVIVTVLSAILTFALRPKIPNASLRNTNQSSPNNELSNRSNRERPNERIPDIYGTVLAYPDLIGMPYSGFDDSGREFIVDLMCLGRGRYAIDEDNVKDGETTLSSIPGASCEIYRPYTSQNYGTPQLVIGDEIPEPMMKVFRSNDVVGQLLRAPNDNYSRGTGDIAFVYPNKIWYNPAGSRPQVGEVFRVGDTVDITNATYTDGTTAVDLSGVGYEIESITDIALTEGSFTLVEPWTINADWNLLDEYVDTVGAGAPSTGYISPTIEAVGEQWVGPFIVGVTDMTHIYVNFVARNGLFKDNGDYQSPVSVELELEATPVDASGTPIGSAQTQQITMVGSSSSRDIIGATLQMELNVIGRHSVRARRITLVDTDFEGQVVDEVTWRDMFAMSAITENDFGDVTTIYAKTRAVTGATEGKQKKLNILCTRQLPVWLGGQRFSYNYTATNSAADILAAVCLDPFIGRRTRDEIDFGNFYETIEEINEYYGDTDSSEFCYTFGSDNISFDETIRSITGAIGCEPYRKGSVLKIKFEKRTDDSVMVFNHRNKVPMTEARQVRFGGSHDQDGLELQYVDPDDNDALKVIYIPETRTATAPKKIETVGVRNRAQASRLAWRSWYKMQYQNTVTEFDCLPSAYLLKPTDRVLIADNTRIDMRDGHIVSVDSLILELSQPCALAETESWVIYLQIPDGTVQTIPVTQGADEFHVVLAEAPMSSLAPYPESKEPCRYAIYSTTEPTPTAFLVTEKLPADKKMLFKISAGNYDSRYYWYDDLILWLTFEDGTYYDSSVSQIDPQPQNGASVAQSDQLGLAHYSATNGPSEPQIQYVTLPDFTTTASYTKSIKIVKLSTVPVQSEDRGHVLSSPDIDVERLWVSETNVIYAGHNATDQVSAELPGLDTAVLVTVSYDADSDVMKLYVDGELEDEASSVGQRDLGGLQLFSYYASEFYYRPMVGYGKDVRYWKRALTDKEVKLLYLSTRETNVNYSELARLVLDVMPENLQYFPS